MHFSPSISLSASPDVFLSFLFYPIYFSCLFFAAALFFLHHLFVYLSHFPHVSFSLPLIVSVSHFLAQSGRRRHDQCLFGKNSTDEPRYRQQNEKFMSVEPQKKNNRKKTYTLNDFNCESRGEISNNFCWHFLSLKLISF